jgi:hypothetical protein
MVPTLFFYQLVLVALVWLCVMLQWAWPSDSATCPTTREPTPPLPKRHREPTPFAGLITKPHCDGYCRDAWWEISPGVFVLMKTGMYRRPQAS